MQTYYNNPNQAQSCTMITVAVLDFTESFLSRLHSFQERAKFFQLQSCQAIQHGTSFSQLLVLLQLLPYIHHSHQRRKGMHVYISKASTTMATRITQYILYIYMRFTCVCESKLIIRQKNSDTVTSIYQDVLYIKML